MTSAPNRHAVALVLAETGVLIFGPSGSGKTTLALALLSRVQAVGRFARLVADDQVFLSDGGGRLVASAPPPIAGLAEAYGAGPAYVHYLPRAVVDLAVELVEPSGAPRISDRVIEPLPGHRLPLLELPRRNAEANIYPVLSRLRLPPFCRSSAPDGPESGESPQIGACQHASR